MNPYSITDLPFLLALPVLLGLSGFFSGSETAMFGLSSQNRLTLMRSPVVGRAFGDLMSDLRMLLITLMFGNMLINVLYFVVSSVLLFKLDPKQVHPILITAATLAPLLTIIVFGEVVPKLLANTAPVKWVGVTCLPLLIVHRVIGPLRVILNRWVITPLGRLVAPGSEVQSLSQEELAALLDLSKHRGVIDPDEEQQLRAVVRLGEMKVREIMVPRVDVEAIDINATVDAIRQAVVGTRLTKFPVYEGDLDHIVGLVYSRQVLLALGGPQPPHLATLVRQVRYVPEQQRVDRLLDEFRKTRTHYAVVVDEYGGTAGIVTLKDAVECMVGDLDMDEAPGEGDEPVAEQIDPSTWRVSGELSVRDWADAFGLVDLPGRAATVGGLVMTLIGRLPRVGDRVRLGNLQLEVETMEHRRVASVRLELRETADRAAATGGPTKGGRP